MSEDPQVRGAAMLQALACGELEIRDPKVREWFAEDSRNERQWLDLCAVQEQLSVLAPLSQTERSEQVSASSSADARLVRRSLQRARPGLLPASLSWRRWHPLLVVLAAAALVSLTWWGLGSPAPQSVPQGSLGGPSAVKVVDSPSGITLQFAHPPALGGRIRLRALHAQGQQQGSPIEGFEATTENQTWPLPQAWQQLLDERGGLLIAVERLDLMGQLEGSGEVLELSSPPR